MRICNKKKTRPKQALKNQIFKRFFALLFSYCKFLSFFAAFSMKFACFFKSRPSKFMRPRSVSWPSTLFNGFRKNHQKSSKNLPKILPKPSPKPRKMDPKSQQIIKKTQDNLRCAKNAKKMRKSAKNGPQTCPKGAYSKMLRSPRCPAWLPKLPL